MAWADPIPLVGRVVAQPTFCAPFTSPISPGHYTAKISEFLTQFVKEPRARRAGRNAAAADDSDADEDEDEGLELDAMDLDGAGEGQSRFKYMRMLVCPGHFIIHRAAG